MKPVPLCLAGIGEPYGVVEGSFYDFVVSIAAQHLGAQCTFGAQITVTDAHIEVLLSVGVPRDMIRSLIQNIQQTLHAEFPDVPFEVW